MSENEVKSRSVMVRLLSDEAVSSNNEGGGLVAEGGDIVLVMAVEGEKPITLVEAGEGRMGGGEGERGAEIGVRGVGCDGRKGGLEKKSSLFGKENCKRRGREGHARDGKE